jgi:hypothetical protein
MMAQELEYLQTLAAQEYRHRTWAVEQVPYCYHQSNCFRKRRQGQRMTIRPTTLPQQQNQKL